MDCRDLSARDWRAAEASLQVPALALATPEGAAAAATATFLSARDWRAAEASLQVPAFALATPKRAAAAATATTGCFNEGGAQRSQSSRRGSRVSYRVALPPCEAGGSGLSSEDARSASRTWLNATHEPRVAITRGDATRDVPRSWASSSRAALRSALVRLFGVRLMYASVG
jgi:hypothetical protein